MPEGAFDNGLPLALLPALLPALDSEPAPLSQVEYGYLRVRGVLSSIGLDTKHVYMDHRDDVNKHSSICLPISTYTKHSNDNPDGRRCLVGLILEPSSEFKNEYRRVGAFHTYSEYVVIGMFIMKLRDRTLYV